MSTVEDDPRTFWQCPYCRHDLDDHRQVGSSLACTVCSCRT